MHHARLSAAVFMAGLIALFGIEARAEKAEAHHEHFAKCAKVCADCSITCDMCFHHCASLVAEGMKDHVKTMNTCVDCAECCKLSATLCARHSPFAVMACECCAKCCDECATACGKFKDHKQMVECAKSCVECAKACRTMIEQMKK